MLLPAPRGPISAAVIGSLRDAGPLDAAAVTGLIEDLASALLDEDAQVALWVLYELHYGGFEDVVGDREFDPDLLRARSALEATFERDLRARTAAAMTGPWSAGADVDDRIFRQIDAWEGPSLSRFLQREATAEQFLEVLVHRSIYQLKEADPHTFVVPRITGSAKVALVELQYDEYGAG